MRTFQHKFVELIPDTLREGILYISIPYKSAAHNCFCGCGHIVYTPLIAGRWSLIFQGKHVSLLPSVGSRNLACQSHYFLTENEVEWLRPFSKDGDENDPGVEPFSFRELIRRTFKKNGKRKKKG